MFRNTKHAFFILVLFAIFSGAAAAQKPKPQPTPMRIPPDIPVVTPTPLPQLTDEQVLDAVEAGTRNYVETFKNLLADETKRFELFGKNGEVKKTRVIRSSFIVLPLMKAADQVVEFRNVTEVDGKKVDDSDKRAGELFEKLASAETSEKEIDKLRDESSRHDLEVAISGMTLFQALEVNRELRKYFEFDIKRAYDAGVPIYAISYTQTADSPDITVNARDARPVGRPGLNFDVEIEKDQALPARINGTLVVDAVTMKIRSEVRNVTVLPPGFSSPVTVVEDRLTYQESQFGIFTPKLISHTQYSVNLKDQTVRKEVNVTFEYGNFSRPDVEVKSSEVKP